MKEYQVVTKEKPEVYPGQIIRVDKGAIVSGQLDVVDDDTGWTASKPTPFLRANYMFVVELKKDDTGKHLVYSPEAMLAEARKRDRARVTFVSGLIAVLSLAALIGYSREMPGVNSSASGQSDQESYSKSQSDQEAYNKRRADEEKTEQTKWAIDFSRENRYQRSKGATTEEAFVESVNKANSNR
jgi:hypothetical protein